MTREHAILEWSPSGKKILFNDSETEVYTIWPDGNGRAVISDGESYDATWSPDGRKIAFLEDRSGSEISISQEDGTVKWVQIDRGPYQKIGAPMWSPDGSRLIFTCSNKDGSDLALFSVEFKDGRQIMKKIYDGHIKNLAWQAR